MSIRVNLNHQLDYRFDRAIILGPQTLGLRPAPHCRTAIISYALKIEPSEHGITWQQDPYGNFLARLNFSNKTDRLKIAVDIIAELQPINPFNFFLEDYATRYPFTYETQLGKDLAPFLEIADCGSLLQSWVDKHRQADIYTSDFIVDINQQLANEITHKIRLEPGIQSCTETLEKKVGSCRDTGWLLVQICRHYGLAARFVSGYLIQLQADIPPLDGPPGPESDSGDLHAWAEVYLPGAGWIGLDPTSGLLAAEGHIPLVCSASPESASPLRGTSEPCQSKLEFSVTVSRDRDRPRVSKPYSEEQWQEINALGKAVEAKLQALGVGLTMGGEPTFVSIDDFTSPQWQIAALGEEKRRIAGKLLQRLENRFARGGALLHSGLGKCYPGEVMPPWTLGCYWRQDGLPIWRDRGLIASDGQDCGYTQTEAEIFIQTLVKHLGVTPACIIPSYELETESIAGYVLPILPVKSGADLYWSSCRWSLPENKLYLIKGDSPVGLRLPLQNLPWSQVQLRSEAIVPLDHPPTIASPEPRESPQDAIRIALTIEARSGMLHVFVPPISSARTYLDLIAAIEATAQEVEMPVLIVGYTPPGREIIGFQITPDPGVIEVNVYPAATWDELVNITTILYEEARQCRLGTEKYLRDGRPISTGGGSHITIGGQTLAASPLLRRPDLLRSLISYWQNHPSLSYVFAGLFVGSTSQSPRVDEARHESLYDLEIAFAALEPGREVPAEVIDRLLRHLLADVTGNTHRTAFCIDKLFPVENPRNQLGLLEFRSFVMPPHPRMSLLQMLLLRGLVAWFWEKPYTKSTIRWGTTLHDRFMLPYYLEVDLQEAIGDLQSAGYPFKLEWFAPFFEFRFPRYGEITRVGVQLELRQAIEPWLVLGEKATSGETARYVDDSMERLQVMLRGAIGNSPNRDNFGDRYVVLCNGRRVPLKSTGVAGEYVGGVRFRARKYTALLHPAINPHSPLIFDIVDTLTERSLGGCTYYVNPPNGATYDRLPVNDREASSRMAERFVAMGHTPGKIEVPPLRLSPEYPLTLDLRREM